METGTETGTERVVLGSRSCSTCLSFAYLLYPLITSLCSLSHLPPVSVSIPASHGCPYRQLFLSSQLPLHQPLHQSLFWSCSPASVPAVVLLQYPPLYPSLFWSVPASVPACGLTSAPPLCPSPRSCRAVYRHAHRHVHRHACGYMYRRASAMLCWKALVETVQRAPEMF